MPSLQEFAAAIERLERAVRRLESEADWLRLAPLGEREWFRLIPDKLLPQLTDDAFLVVAVVGGTNTGKSVVFNHLAGTAMSAAVPEAAGTKHPVCLVPTGFSENHAIDELFGGFALRDWVSSDEARDDSSDDLLFWRELDVVPANMLILDTPDIDSDARVNWPRADKVRRAADVLIAVLTQQKYNDAAVKDFFRRAAIEEKTVVAVFNQCSIPEDEPWWPKWLGTFCDETGVDPAFVYLAPHDRKAAENLSLPFYERDWPISAEESSQSAESRSLRDDLSRLRFDEIKLRSLGGALRGVVDRERGAPAWLEEIRGRSASTRVVAEQMSAERVIEARGWPVVPFSLVFDEFWSWWRAHRTGWTQSVSSFYDVVNHGVAWPFRQARELFGTTEPRDPVEDYLAAERDAIVRITEDVFARLQLLADASSGPARIEFEKLTTGENRRRFLEEIETAHAAANVRGDLSQLIARDMRAFLDENPRTARWLKRIDVVAVGSRPALSIMLFAVGAHGVEVAAQGLVNVGIDFLAGSAVTVGGDTVFSKAAGSLGAALFARLRALPGRFAEQRAGWLAEQLREQVLGSLPDDLQRTANLPESESFLAAQSAIEELRRLLEGIEFESGKTAAR